MQTAAQPYGLSIDKRYNLQIMRGMYSSLDNIENYMNFRHGSPMSSQNYGKSSLASTRAGHGAIQSGQFNWQRECRRCRISLLQREGYRAGRMEDICEIPLFYVSLPRTLSATVPLVTTSRTFVRLSKSRGELTNLGSDAQCICIFRRVIPRLVIGDSIAECSLRP